MMDGFLDVALKAVSVLGFTALILAFFGGLAGAGELRQYTPMTGDEEEAWLRKQGLTAAEINDIMTPLPHRDDRGHI